MLSNFYEAPFRCPDGTFKSIEGYWHWLALQRPEAEELKNLSGVQAKYVGSSLKGNHPTKRDPLFKLKILRAMVVKATGYPEIAAALKASELPFDHYYIDKKEKEHRPDGLEWMISGWEYIRSLLQDG